METQWSGRKFQQIQDNDYRNKARCFELSGITDLSGKTTLKTVEALEVFRGLH